MREVGWAGFSARQRKDEVERLNEQLRKINLSLRQQAKAGTIYAPGLNYAPPPTFKKSEGGTYAVIEPQQTQPAQKVSSNTGLKAVPRVDSLLECMQEHDSLAARLPFIHICCQMKLTTTKCQLMFERLLATETGLASVAPFSAIKSFFAQDLSCPGTGNHKISCLQESLSRMAPSLGSLMGTIDEDDLPAEQQQCLMALRDGKRLLKEKQGASAMVRFEKALMLAKSTGEKIYERRATRGLAAAARLQVMPQL